MLLHCENDDGVTEAGGVLAWLHDGTLESLREVNESCLGLLAEEARLRGAPDAPLLRQVGELWRALDAGARRRAAACPYLLFDAGFAEPLCWRPQAVQVGEAGRALYTAYFTAAAAEPVTRLVVTYGWHLARAQGPAARLLLGMPGPCAALIARHTLPQIQALAEAHPQWLRPRWPARVQVWRELLLAAAGGESGALERARLRGLTLLAAEARRGSAARI
ncbi:MAG TPA: hypothetical protein VET66_04050 [Steroidobacteraceae bacterium]|nr:hypothetical protein [Steroidobacteraceae bacterium]